MTEIADPHRETFSFSLSEELFLDFEAELADLLRPSGGLSRRSSSSSSLEVARFRSNVRTSGSAQSPFADIEYEPDGTMLCSRINYDTLCNISGRTSLEQLKTLTLCVSCASSSDTLALLSLYTPGLTTLKLDYSRFTSLRVLGEEMSNLKSLSVVGCGLTNLDGIAYAPSLETLVAAENMISDVLALTELRKINTVDLEGNVITDLDSISFLFLCPRLEHLVLRGNPLASDSSYRTAVFRSLPSLKTLDAAITQRASRDFCRRHRKQRDDCDGDNDAAGGGAGATVSGAQDDPTDDGQEDKDDETSCSHESESDAPKKDLLIRKLIKQTTVEEPEIIESKKKILLDNLMKEHQEYKSLEYEATTREESTHSVQENEEKSTPPIETKATTVVATPTFASKDTQMITTDEGSTQESSPTPTGKLLNRRKSLDPLKITRVVEGPPATKICQTERRSSQPLGLETQQQDLLGPALPSLSRRESFASLDMASMASEEQTTDSGFENGSKSSGNIQESSVTSGIQRPDRDSDRGARTVKNRFDAITRQDSRLQGIKRQEGDIEIEEFE